MNKRKELLKETLKRHKQILEYNFPSVPEGDDPKWQNGEDDLLLDNDGMFTEQEEMPEESGDEVIPTEEPIPADEANPTNEEDPFGGDASVEDEMAVEEPTATGGDQVEVDVTDIVDKAEEAKQQATQASSKIDDLLTKFGELEQKLGGMDAIISKMDELEKEVIQRNPTPTEKLNMRSLSSFPYSIKLTDFWAQREGYDTGGEEVEKESYSLTNKDIEDSYDEKKIKDSFKLDK